MSTQIASYYDMVTQLPEGASITFHDVSWDENEELLEQVGQAPGLRISFDNGCLCLMRPFAMSTVQQIREAVSRLHEQDLAGFRVWFAEFDADLWDRQFDADVSAGQLDQFAQEALNDLRQARYSEL